MKKLVLLLAITSLFACSKSDEVGPFIIDRSFDLSVFNSLDEDLLDPVTTNHYESNDIKVFYEIDGKKIRATNPTIYQHENEYRIKLYLNDSNTSDKSITYIQWNTSDTDTIEAVIEKAETKTLKRTVWLNNLEIWDWTIDDEGYFKLIK